MEPAARHLGTGALKAYLGRRWRPAALVAALLSQLIAGELGAQLDTPPEPAPSPTWLTPTQNGDDTGRLQEAIDRGRLDLGPGRFTLTRSLEAAEDGLFIQGAGIDRTILDASKMDDFVYGDGSGVVVAKGSLSELPSLAIPAQSGSLALSLRDAPEIQVDDVLVLFDRRQSSYSKSRPYYRNGEHIRVAAIKDTRITLHRTLLSSYTVENTTVYHLRGIPVTIRDLTIIGRPQETRARSVLSLDLASPVRVENLRVSGGTYAGLRLSRSHDFELRGVIAHDDHRANHQTDYGLVIGNSQRGLVSGGRFAAARHAIAMGGNDEPGSIPCRDIVVAGAVASVSQPGSFALDCHGNCEDITYRDMRVYGGVSLGGNRTHLKDSRVETSADLTSGQVPIYFSEFSGFDHQITGCDIRSGSRDPDRGLFIDVGGNDVNTLNAATRFGGTLTLRDNRLRYQGPETETAAITIKNRGYEGPEPLNLDISGNTVESTTAIGYFLNVVRSEGKRFHRLSSGMNRATGSGFRLRGIDEVLSQNDVFEGGLRAGVDAGYIVDRLAIANTRFLNQALASYLSGPTQDTNLTIDLRGNHWSLAPGEAGVRKSDFVVTVFRARSVLAHNEVFGTLDTIPPETEVPTNFRFEGVRHLRVGTIVDLANRDIEVVGDTHLIPIR